jgi:hypothetical protein
MKATYLFTKKDISISASAALAVISSISTVNYKLTASDIVGILVSIMLASIPGIILWGV